MNSTATPIASVEDFKRALLSWRDKLPDSHLELLKAQAKEPGGVITSAKLAAAAGYANFNAANLNYGTLAANIGQFLSYTPPNRKDGTAMSWTVLSYSVDGTSEPESGHFQFIMRPELLAALREMKWIRL
jgi:hypothetical protein